MSCFSERLKTDHHVDEGIDGNANLLIMKNDFKTRREGRHCWGSHMILRYFVCLKWMCRYI